MSQIKVLWRKQTSAAGHLKRCFKFLAEGSARYPCVGCLELAKTKCDRVLRSGHRVAANEKNGEKWSELKRLHYGSFFKTLIDNCEMAMKKCYFPLTEFLSKHPRYGEL